MAWSLKAGWNFTKAMWTSKVVEEERLISEQQIVRDIDLAFLQSFFEEGNLIPSTEKDSHTASTRYLSFWKVASGRLRGGIQ